MEGVRSVRSWRIQRPLQEGEKKKKAVKPLKAVSFWQLFQCADVMGASVTCPTRLLACKQCIAVAIAASNDCV